MIQRCSRWLIAFDESYWFVTESGKFLHFAPGAGPTSMSVYNWSSCGARVSPGKTRVLRDHGGLGKFFPCSRCVDDAHGDAALTNQIRYLNKHVDILAKEIVNLMQRKVV